MEQRNPKTSPGLPEASLPGECREKESPRQGPAIRTAAEHRTPAACSTETSWPGFSFFHHSFRNGPVIISLPEVFHRKWAQDLPIRVFIHGSGHVGLMEVPGEIVKRHQCQTG